MNQEYNRSSVQKFYGLSTDNKPTDCEPGSRFVEIDTATKYIYNKSGSSWTEIPAGGGGGGSVSGVGKNVTGTQYTIDGQSVTAGDGAEIFNNYTGTRAAGMYSHAEGSGTTASGDSSHSEGSGTYAKGNASHAEGGGSRATGAQSHAEGSATNATNNSSHAEGAVSTASGATSHAEGNNTTASGTSSHSEGSGTTASGNYSHAEGSGSTASGDTSHAEGSGCQSGGSFSHAEGRATYANAECSHAEGYGTSASSSYQHVEGKYNVADSNNKFAFIIGNGTLASRHNAFAIDWDGKIYVNGADTGIDVLALYNMLIPMTQDAYDALTDKTLPLYFVYEE